MTEYRQRSVSVRVLAKELEVSNVVQKEDEDDDMSPKNLMLPSGGKANRVLISGTLLNVEEKSEGFWKATISDGSGSTALVFASSKYQKNSVKKIKNIDAPEYISVVGKPRAYEPDEDTTIITIRPEEINTIDSMVRDYRIYESAKMTVKRLSDEEYPDDYNSEQRTELVEGVIETLENLVE